MNIVLKFKVISLNTFLCQVNQLNLVLSSTMNILSEMKQRKQYCPDLKKKIIIPYNIE